LISLKYSLLFPFLYLKYLITRSTDKDDDEKKEKKKERKEKPKKLKREEDDGSGSEWQTVNKGPNSLYVSEY